MTVDAPQQKRRYWLITSPRTASNMLVKILNLEAQGTRPCFGSGYFFHQGMLTRRMINRKSMKEWTPEEKASVDVKQKECFENLQQFIEDSENDGQLVLIKEHALMLNDPLYEEQYLHGKDDIAREITEPPPTLPMRGVANPTRSPLNLTSLPDEFLNTMTPTFLIRHPIMQLPSLIRAVHAKEMADLKFAASTTPKDVEMSSKWIRSLYDFYASQKSTSTSNGKSNSFPIILDADDVMLYPALVEKYADIVGLDREKLRFSWKKATEEEMEKLDPQARHMLKSLNASDGVDPSKLAANYNLDDEAKKWRVEFGEARGANLEKLVREALPDYEYMRERRLRL
ncbi:hypothetical protein F5Y16DRAFT_385721 [Xylariaceae sp. FL0255]|nr:hypothetical protein F5Y16DRAFT_385721 [Xylariaceae sp. FL0255]